MKHSRNENIKYNVGLYLKGRHYTDTDNFRRSDLSLVHSSSQMAVASTVEKESSFANSIIYSCSNNDLFTTDTQFSKLKVWINELKGESKEELRCLLFPLVCHLYIEILKDGHAEEAVGFLKRHQAVGTEDDSISVLNELASIKCTKDIESRRSINMLRSSKYQLILSTQSLELLKHYLTTNAHIILIQVINTWFDIEEKNEADAIIYDQLNHDNEVKPGCNGYSDYSKHNNTTETSRLEDVIRAVKDSRPTPSPLLLYTLCNTENSATCARVSNDGRVLSTGFSTSEIKLWSLSDKKLKCSSKFQTKCRKIKLAVDYDDRDEDLENSVKPVPGGEAVTLLGHSDCVQDVAFVPRTRIIVSVSMDQTLRAWDLGTFTCRATYRGHVYPIWTVDVSNLGYNIATGSHDRTARLWSLERNYPLRIFAGHTQDVDSLKFHPNDSYLATGSSDKSVRLWSVASGELVRVLPGHRGCIYTMSFSPDGKYLATAGEDKKIKIWDISSAAVLSELKGHTETVVGLSWSPDGQFLASSSLDNTIRIWCTKNSFENDESSLLQNPFVYTSNCNSLLSLSYSNNNSPICVGTR